MVDKYLLQIYICSSKASLSLRIMDFKLMDYQLCSQMPVCQCYQEIITASVSLSFYQVPGTILHTSCLLLQVFNEETRARGVTDMAQGLS